MENQDIFLLALVASITPLLIFFIKAIYKSKCTDVSCCCGLLVFKRNVEIESGSLDDPDIKKNTPDKKNSVIGKQNQEVKREDLI